MIMSWEKISNLLLATGNYGCEGRVSVVVGDSGGTSPGYRNEAARASCHYINQGAEVAPALGQAIGEKGEEILTLDVRRFVAAYMAEGCRASRAVYSAEDEEDEWVYVEPPIHLDLGGRDDLLPKGIVDALHGKTSVDWGAPVTDEESVAANRWLRHYNYARALNGVCDTGRHESDPERIARLRAIRDQLFELVASD